MSTLEELPSPNMGAFYKNEDQTLYIKRDIGNSVALCQCVAQELGHAQLAMNCEAYSRRDMGFSAVCVGYMLCRKFGVDVKNFAIDRIPEELAGKSLRKFVRSFQDPFCDERDWLPCVGGNLPSPSRPKQRSGKMRCE